MNYQLIKIYFLIDQYSERRQQDSQEFLLYLLDQIHEDLNRVEKKPFVEQKEYFNELNQKELEKLAADSWGDYLKRNKSVIVDLFQGQMKNSLQCLKCNAVKYQFEPFMYLTVPISPDSKTEVTIQDCIQQFIQKEELDGDEKWQNFNNDYNFFTLCTKIIIIPIL